MPMKVLLWQSTMPFMKRRLVEQVQNEQQKVEDERKQCLHRPYVLSAHPLVQGLGPSNLFYLIYSLHNSGHMHGYNVHLFCLLDVY